MFKKYFATLLFSFITIVSTYAAEPVFANNDTESFNLKPLNVETKSPVSTTNVKDAVQIKTVDNTLSDQNFQKAIGSLDTAQVDLREQLQTYAAYMQSSKSSYLCKRGEYRAYKKQYNAVKKRISRLEKSKKLIQENISTLEK